MKTSVSSIDRHEIVDRRDDGPTRGWPTAIVAGVALLACLLTGCSGSKQHSVTKARKSTPATKSATIAKVPARVEGVRLRNAELTMTGRDGELSATVSNNSSKAVVLRSFACACAGSVQVGKQSDGKLTPIVAGVPVPANGSASIGSGTKVVVRFSDLAPSVKRGGSVTVTSISVRPARSAQRSKSAADAILRDSRRYRERVTGTANG